MAGAGPARADAQTHSRPVGWSGWGRKPAGGRRRKPGLISTRGQDRLPWPQIGTPGRLVRSVGSTGRQPGLGPPATRAAKDPGSCHTPRWAPCCLLTLHWSSVHTLRGGALGTHENHTGAGPGEGGQEPRPGRRTEGSGSQSHSGGAGAAAQPLWALVSTSVKQGVQHLTPTFSLSLFRVSHVHPEPLQLTPHMAASPPTSPCLLLLCPCLPRGFP